jgi:hypothetical protein
MAKSRRGSLVPSPLPLLSLRGAGGDAAISEDSPRGRQQCLARAEMLHRISSPLTGED